MNSEFWKHFLCPIFRYFSAHLNLVINRLSFHLFMIYLSHHFLNLLGINISQMYCLCLFTNTYISKYYISKSSLMSCQTCINVSYVLCNKYMYLIKQTVTCIFYTLTRPASILMNLDKDLNRRYFLRKNNVVQIKNKSTKSA